MFPNDAHLHLLVNHTPFFTSSIGLLALVIARFRSSVDMRWLAIFLFVVAGVGSFAANETGEDAEEMVEHIEGVTHALIHEHEEAAEKANIMAILLAVSSIVLGAVSLYRKQFLNLATNIVLILAVLVSIAMARTSYLGGQVRHTEIREGFVPPVND